MENLEIVTDGVERDIVSWLGLTDEERAEFDYLDAGHQEEASFFRFQGKIYNLGEFCRISGRSSIDDISVLRVDDDSPLFQWDGYLTEAYDSMILVRYTDDKEAIVIGTAKY